LVAVAAFFAAGAAFSAAGFFAFAVAILVSPSSRDENYAQDLNPSGKMAGRIIHRHKRYVCANEFGIS
jgi:hypothetical protein